LDAVFSTATFHWVTDHPRLFAGIHAALRPGGRLVAQCGGGPNIRRLHDRALRLAAAADYAPHFARWQDPWEYADAPTTARRLGDRPGTVGGGDPGTERLEALRRAGAGGEPAGQVGGDGGERASPGAAGGGAGDVEHHRGLLALELDPGGVEGGQIAVEP